ncbi:MAG: helix-turn-helix domain-containing protein, partial [Lapillicoccus sp.]
LERAAAADLVAVPAYPRDTRLPESALDVLRAAVDRGATVLSVCSGAFALGDAGLLDGRRCTTHWMYSAVLAERYPRAEVDPAVLYVDAGQVITSAGTAAGIDACLHLVRRELGAAVATRIARRMVVPPQRDGGQRQFVDLPVQQTAADSLEPVLTWMLEHLEQEQPIRELARRAAMSERTFARRFVAETGTTPARWLALRRLHHARVLLEQTDLSIEAVATNSGFGTAALLRHHFVRQVGVPPGDYRRTFSARPAVRVGA